MSVETAKILPLRDGAGTKPKIVAKNVQKYFGNVLAMEDISCTINEREFVAIIGPSGCGKSTFLYLIAGFEKASQGELLINNELVVGPGPDRGVVFQEFVLFPWLTVLRNATLGLDIKGVPRQEAEERARKWLRLTGLSGFENAYPSSLSGGMKQRVAIARALSYDPEVLLLDEPFGALDVQTKNYMIQDLQNLWVEANRTIVMITHSVSEAVQLADRVLILSSRPSRIIADVAIKLPHPRDLRDPQVRRYEDEVTALLSAEVDKAMKRERQTFAGRS
ncbi:MULTISPECIES: ABC transporter ATP-binding protein [Bradyrhizobium]|uniref:ABC transporter ATP-binding protein n=3 Tax=Bradyrhizobium TaxID=374 RepID=A0A410VJB1_9BRAD|nr:MULTISPECIES: ABC transporter ATP-binding protein [Bradyrhizobium]MCG2629321.1 ABC transporter ATP-binding protein [Bradyrhizobium zhengyangense]MCG2644602.1 ABC transporter ATP-binding protein [Bradyrhizobium zhengyangense]MCG2670835.1 ABC transporter ATP-binding protein [Bradyrhizobium zhengyangense]MDN4984467.1 ABC transporter ATP-binding protein [Bradyrhizobium sp. WYCCWR 13022]MDN5002459.1 ABC transporter ATP-binding protein [Bradyrhizobium sp. WYCCWR 12677]